jgi:hypothetical protein
MAHVSAARAAGRTVEPDAGEAGELVKNEILGLHEDIREEEAGSEAERYGLRQQGKAEGNRLLARVLRDLFGNPFRPVTFSPSWRTSSALALAATMYDSHDFTPMPVLADALEEAGCDDAGILSHCREQGTHVRGCWVVDLILGKS